MMGKRVWIVNYYAGNPNEASNPRYTQFAKHFMAAGYEVVIFNSSRTAKVNDAEFRTSNFIERQYGDYRFVHVRVPSFKGNGVRRMFSIWKFARNLLKGCQRFERPDIILQNIHPPFDYPIVKMAQKLQTKYIAEAWDLWPEDFVTFGLVKASNPAMKFAYAIEKQYYYHADEIVFTFLGAFDYLKRQGWMREQGGKIDSEHVHYINNGIDIEQFDRDREEHPRLDEDINDDEFYRVVYLGSIQRANNMKTLIDAAALLKDNPKYRFFIYGNGAYREELERFVVDNHIDNVVFKECHISFAECAWVASRATVGIMSYEKCFGRWGVSSGKMFQYLAAGRPIVCNVDIAYDNVINDNNLGVARDIDNADDFAAAIRSIAEQPKEDYEAMCNRVRAVGEQFDYKELAAREIKLLG